jgi:hypothetical protein
VTQAVEHLPSKHEALSSSLSTEKNKKGSFLFLVIFASVLNHEIRLLFQHVGEPNIL